MYRVWEEPPGGSVPDDNFQGTQPVHSQSQPLSVDERPLVVARLLAMDSAAESIDFTIDFTTDAKAIVMGRKASCSVVLEDPTISATHCRFYFDNQLPLGSCHPELIRKHAEQQQQAKLLWEPSRSVTTTGEVFYGASHFWIEDLSSNGTFVNMVRLGKGCKARLCHNDVISLCKPEQKRKTKGTKLTWLFQLAHPEKLRDSDDYPSAITDRYFIKDTLGTGAFSQVKLAIERTSGRLVAMKMLDKFKYTGGTRTGDSLAREVEILKKLSHPNIIQILDVVDTDRMLFIVLELAQGGELFEQIAKKERHTEEQARAIFVQLLQAILYLHSNNVVHRDLKPENILLHGDCVKLTDFGFSRVVGEQEMMKTLCGTPLYLAPEVLSLSMGTTEPSFETATGYGKAVDMWSLGVILYMLLSGRPPWDDSHFGKLCETVLSGAYSFPLERWDGVSNSAKMLCSRLLTVDPMKRITVEEALKHDWVLGIVHDDEAVVTMSPPPARRHKDFAVPSSKKKRERGPGEEHKENNVLRLIQERDALPTSPELGKWATEGTPLLPTSASPSVREDEEVNVSPVVRRLGFETPEKKLNTSL